MVILAPNKAIFIFKVSWDSSVCRGN